MAMLWAQLAAEDCRTRVLVERASQPPKPVLEVEALPTGEVVIVPRPVVAGSVIGPTTQRVAHEDIADAGLLDCGRQAFLGEDRIETRVRHGADIDQISHIVRAEQRQHIAQLTVAVAKREQGSSHHATVLSLPDRLPAGERLQRLKRRNQARITVGAAISTWFAHRAASPTRTTIGRSAPRFAAS